MNTLYGKLALALTGLLIAIGLLYILLSQSLTERYMLAVDQQFNRDLAHNMITDRALVSQGEIDKAALKRTFDMYMAINPSIEIYLLDMAGRILAYSADPGVVKRNTVSLEPIRRFLAGETLPLVGDDPRSHDRRKSFSVAAIPSAQAPQAYLYVVLRGEQFAAIENLYQDSLLLRLSAWILAGSLIFGLISGLLLFYWLTRRIRRLNTAMMQFRNSQFQVHQRYAGGAERMGGDEIDRLGTGFDAMAERIQVMLTELQEQDSLRRELINNVSHDLRTPLTCLHGYLQTLQLKGASIDSAEQADYLAAALGHSESLGKLIAELFELAKLDARAVQPHYEAFSPAELLSDVVQKFQPRAQQLNISLEFSLPEQCGFIRADIGLLERVLENLITNALQHTPNAGHITLALSQHEQQISISVRDTGEGIAAADISKIFKRYYRGGNNNSSSGAGLGLAIAERIVELHDSELQVNSRPGEGSSFSFALPAC